MAGIVSNSFRLIPVIFISFLSSCGIQQAATGIKQARAGKLNLSHSHLTEIPSWVFDMPGLRVLNLHDNKIDSIPDDIGKLVNLEKLIVSRNNLTCISPEIGKLKKLKSFLLKQINLKFYRLKLVN